MSARPDAGRLGLHQRRRDAVGLAGMLGGFLFDGPGLPASGGLEIIGVGVRSGPEAAKGVFAVLMVVPVVTAGKVCADLPALPFFVAVHSLDRCHNGVGVRVHQPASTDKGAPGAGGFFVMALIAGVVLDGPQVQHCAGEWPVLPVENAGVVLRLQILLRHFHQDFGLVSEILFHVCISLPAFACQMVFMLSGDSPMSARRIAPAAGLTPAAADAVGLAGVWEVRKSLAACGRCCAFNFAGQLLTCPVAIRSVFKVQLTSLLLDRS